ncbi:AI-2E family transporter [Pseudorhodoplanes sp.]|uniref:AI-2E family transporter n=1 Tax=Pseudorhodoplanes sp. TaxID=1934341 RepID=UPI003D13D07D
MSQDSSGSLFSSDHFLRRLVQISVFVILLLLAWQLAHLLLLIFGSVVIATILRGSANGLTRWLHVPQSWSLAVAGLLLAAVVGGTIMLLGTQIAAQLGQLSGQLSANINKLHTQLESMGIPEQLKDSSIVGTVADNVTSFGKALAGAIADAALVIVAGIYLAIDPELYRRGTIMLFPHSVQPRIQNAMDASGTALGQWLLAQLIAMLIIGFLSAVGLYLIGVPSALALALIAGVTEFIPYLGPWLGALPALLVAWSQGPDVLLWTAVLYLGIQQFEAYVISPLLARQMVAVPPAVGLFAVVAFGLAFGPFGLILAFPLAVVTMVMVVKLYLQPELKEDVQAPGEKPSDV